MSYLFHSTAGPGLPTSTPRTLQAGQKRSHPSYIQDHYPSFPDPHTYIRTAVGTHLLQLLIRNESDYIKRNYIQLVIHDKRTTLQVVVQFVRVG